MSRIGGRRLAAGLLAGVVAIALYAGARHKRDFWDFEVYRTAGARALHGEPLYRADDGHYQFKYWPAFAFAAAPYALIPSEAGKVIWYAVSVLCFAALVRWSILLLPDRHRTVPALAWIALLITGKFAVKELVNGQTNTLMALLAVLALAAVRARRPALAGACIGVATVVKPYALLLLPWLAVTAGPLAAGAAAGVIAAVLALPALVYGWSGNLALVAGWLATVTGTTAENLLVAENISFASMWAKWIGISPAASRAAVATSVAVLAVVAVAWLLRRRARDPGYLELGALLLVTPLVSPQGWDYVLLIGMPALVAIADRMGRSPRWWQAAAAAGFLLTSFMIYDVVGRRLYLAAVHAGLETVGALVLLACLLRLRLARQL
jgi:hypothetical protein